MYFYICSLATSILFFVFKPLSEAAPGVNLIGFVIGAILGVFVWFKKSRVAMSLIMFDYIVSQISIIAAGQVKSFNFLIVFFVIAYIGGLRGTIKWHKIKKAGN